jgi:hypothetical protein
MKKLTKNFPLKQFNRIHDCKLKIDKIQKRVLLKNVQNSTFTKIENSHVKHLDLDWDRKDFIHNFSKSSTKSGSKIMKNPNDCASSEFNESTSFTDVLLWMEKVHTSKN